MSERFLEEQIKRIRELTARISESGRRRAELTQLLERARRAYGPLEEVRDLSPYGSADEPLPDPREPTRRRRHVRRTRRRRR
jgi:hypothetical protein